LILVAVANLEAPVYQVIYQCKTLFTALFSRLFLARILEFSQWIALLVLVAGMVIAVLATNFSTTANANQNVLTGLVSLIIVGLLSAGASVYFEKMLKTEIEGPAKVAGLWLRNIPLGLFALPLSAGAMLLTDWDQVREYGVLQGFDNVVVWLVVLLIGVGGLLVAATMKYAPTAIRPLPEHVHFILLESAIASMCRPTPVCTRRYADNIVKCFATAIAIVLDIVLSIPIFHFIPSWSFVVGAPLVIVATVLYSMAPKNVCGLDDMDCPGPCLCFGDKARPAATKPTETNKLINN
jgi:UDP-sugar transporter A1/2/3